MSDELIFDSERQMLRAEKKRRLIPLLALAAILVLVVVVVLILRGCRAETHTGGEITDYPYTWTLKSNGDTQLVIPHGDLPNGHWDLKDGEESLPVLRVSREEKEQKGGTVFTLHPEAAGRCLITFILKGADDAVIPNYQMIILAEVTETDGRLSAAPLNAAGTGFQPELVGGGDGGSSYRIHSDSAGDLVLSYPASETETDWTYEILQGENSLRVLGLLYEDGNMNAYLRAGANPGPSTLLLKSELAYATITLSLQTGTDGSLKVVSHEVEYAERPEPEPSTEPAPTETGGDEVVATTGEIPIFSDDHHLEMSENPDEEPSYPLPETETPSDEADASGEENENP